MKYLKKNYYLLLAFHFFKYDTSPLNFIFFIIQNGKIIYSMNIFKILFSVFLLPYFNFSYNNKDLLKSLFLLFLDLNLWTFLRYYNNGTTP